MRRHPICPTRSRVAILGKPDRRAIERLRLAGARRRARNQVGVVELLGLLIGDILQALADRWVVRVEPERAIRQLCGIKGIAELEHQLGCKLDSRRILRIDLQRGPDRNERRGIVTLMER